MLMVAVKEVKDVIGWKEKARRMCLSLIIDSHYDNDREQQLQTAQTNVVLWL